MVIARSGGHPFVRADDITVDVCADVDKIRLKHRAAKVRADDAPIQILKFVIFVLCNMCYMARASEILVPGAVVRFIDRDMASRVCIVAAVDQNVALLRLSVLNSRPAVLPLVEAKAAVGSRPMIRITASTRLSTRFFIRHLLSIKSISLRMHLRTGTLSL